ncbi:MAG: PadR family transcriptional regulator [bacterium]|nr:PadR family transcriptional regulator [bacterium]
MKVLTRSEEILLLAIWHLEENAYGVSIREKVKEMADMSIAFGALYVQLDILVKKGYAKKFLGEPTPERGGKRKKYYTLTENGKLSLQTARELNSSIWDGVPDVAFKGSER